MNVKKLVDICDFISGLWTGKKPPYISVGVIRNTNFHKSGRLDFSDIAQLEVEVKQFSTRQLKFGDIVLEKSGGGPKQPVGRVCVFEKEDGLYSLSNFTSAIRVKNPNELDYSYLHYYLKHLYIEGETVKIQTNSTGIRNLQLGLYKEFSVPLPPLVIQKKIVAKIDAIFAEIDKATAVAEVNAKNAEALFQSYLIQVFDDFGKNYISDTIGNVCILRSGNTVNSNLEKTEGEIPYLKVADMNLIFNKESITTSSRFLSKSDINKKSIIPKGSTIFPKRGGAIDTNKKRITDVDIAVDLNIMSVFPSEKINPYLLYFYFLSLDMKKLGSGSSIRQINNYDIEPLIINFPESMDEQLELIKRISNLKNQSEKLSINYKNRKSELLSLKQSILKKAFIGELVKD